MAELYRLLGADLEQNVDQYRTTLHQEARKGQRLRRTADGLVGLVDNLVPVPDGPIPRKTTGRRLPDASVRELITAAMKELARTSPLPVERLF